jgi:hypothetical protein
LLVEVQHFWGRTAVNTLWVGAKAHVVECIIQDMVGQKSEFIFILVFALYYFDSERCTDYEWVVGKSGWTVAIAAYKRVAKLMGSKPTAQLVIPFAVTYYKSNWNLQ